MILEDDLQSVYLKLHAQPCLHRRAGFLVIVMSINSRQTHGYTSNAYIYSLLFQEKVQSITLAKELASKNT